jgi:hypothetical protein
MRKSLLPAVLVVSILGAAACGGDDNPECEVACVPETTPAPAACEGPDFPCATGPQLDQCPTGCIPEPVV